MDVGVIGCGVMGKNHVRVYSELKSVDQIYVYDPDPNAVKYLPSTCESVTFCPTIADLIQKVDAASICVPTPYHYAVAKQLIEAHIPVLIEKPICQTVKEAEDLVNLIPDDLTVGVGHIERFNAIIPELAQIIKHPHYIEINRHNPASSRIVGTSIIEDLMIHDIDLLFNLFPIKSWSLACSGGDDVATALFTINDCPAILTASRKSSKKVRRIYIEEEYFTVEGDFMAQELYIHRKPGRFSIEGERYSQETTIEKVQVNKSEPLKKELKTFIRAVRDKKKFPVTPKQALNALVLCEQVRSGMQRKGHQSLRESVGSAVADRSISPS
ncbi:Gfo/Idh/MocA family oxidoreductase [Methanoregula sp.]|uniref:Gfo/Idh/MocA family oxidoreductase n=1 Tax=Methanoregula sp. TaxID=2052170 RepID=UPI003C77C46E